MATDVKKQIADTFTARARKVGMDKVTINSIVTECGISRQAFYYYFQDIVDVARYVLRENLDKMLAAGEKASDPHSAVVIFAESLSENFQDMSLALNSKLRTEMELLMIRELTEFFKTVLFRQNCGRDLTRTQMNFHADLIACGITGFVLEHGGERNFNGGEFAQNLWDLISRTYGED